jgi:hypothetical protein
MALFRADPAESLRTVRRLSRSIAGAESNLAIGLCRLGWQAGLISFVRSNSSCSPVLTALSVSEPGPVFARSDRSGGLRSIGTGER